MGILDTIGKGLSIALNIGAKLNVYLASLGLAIDAIRVIGKIFVGLGQGLGLIDKGVKAEDLGDRIIQAEKAGIKPENFTSYEEYANKIKEFKLEPSLSKAISDEEKILKAVEYTTSLSAEKFPSFPWERFAYNLISVPNFKNYFNEDRIGLYGTLIKEQPNSALNIFNYLSRTELNDNKIAKAIDDLKSLEKHLNPKISDNDILNNIREAIIPKNSTIG